MKKVLKSWMVWDSVERAVAIVDGLPAIGLSAETAKQFSDLLNQQDERKPLQKEQRQR
jgi:hypothetical protein